MVWRRRSETPHPHKSRDRGPDSRPPHVRRGPGTHQDSASQRLGRYHHPRPVFHGGHPADLGCHRLLFFIHWLESAICLAWAIVNLLGLLARERTRIEMWAPRGFKKHILPKELKPDGPLLRWTWFEGTEVSKKGWIMALIVLLNLFLKRIFPLFPLKLFLWKKEWNYSLSILKKKKKIKKLRRETILSRMRVARKKVKSAFCNLYLPSLHTLLTTTLYFPKEISTFSFSLHGSKGTKGIHCLQEWRLVNQTSLSLWQ